MVSCVTRLGLVMCLLVLHQVPWLSLAGPGPTGALVGSALGCISGASVAMGGNSGTPGLRQGPASEGWEMGVPLENPPGRKQVFIPFQSHLDHG